MGRSDLVRGGADRQRFGSTRRGHSPVYGARAPTVFEIDGDLVASRLHEEIGVRRHLDCVRTGRRPVKSACGVRARVCAAGRVC